MRLSPKQIALILLAGVGVTSPALAATTTTVTIDAGTIAAGPNVVGNSSYPSSEPELASGSIQANATTPGAKSEIYVAASSLFNAPVTIGDIASISYWTNKPTTSGDPDWTFLIYTKLDPNSTDNGSFYHTRLTSEPYFTQTSTSDDPSNTWHQWATNDPTNPMKFYDSNRAGVTAGTYTDPTLSQIQSGPITWPVSGTTVDYRAEVVNLFSLQTGSAWANGFTGLVDGLKITLTNGDVGIVNLEPAAVPEPASLVMMGTAGLIGLGYFARRRRIK